MRRCLLDGAVIILALKALQGRYWNGDLLASCGFKFITAATALTCKDPLFRAQSYKGAPRFQAKLLIFKLIGPFLWCRPMMKMKLEGRGALL